MPSSTPSIPDPHSSTTPQSITTTSTTVTTISKLSTKIPPYVLGCAAFSGQLTSNPHSLPIPNILRRALSLNYRAFDTSPYYGDSEILLGRALSTLASEGVYNRSECILMTKAGRISSTRFDYSAAHVRASVERSLERLHTTYLDVVFCHDVEFVSEEEVATAIATLYALQAEGKVLHVGISGYPPQRLLSIAVNLRARFSRPLDAIQSYAHFTLQNTTLAEYVPRLRDEAGVDTIFTSSPLCMGLLRLSGVPTADLGDFHPAPRDLRVACRDAAEWVQSQGDDLAALAVRFVAAEWAELGREAPDRLGVGWLAREEREVPRMGMAVILGGSSGVEELEANAREVAKVVDAKGDVRWDVVERDHGLVQGVRRFLGDWVDWSWQSPEEGWVRE